MKQWDYRYGGNDVDQIESFQQTSDGGYIPGGSSFSGISGDKSQALWGGSEVLQAQQKPSGINALDGSHHFPVDLSSVAPGLYVIEIKTGADLIRQKIIIAKQ